MMEEDNVVRPHQEMAQLTLDEKKFLLAVERGDMASTRRMLERAHETDYININCVDPLGRSALLMAIDNENLEMVELLIENKVEAKDALLHAISEEFVEAVEVLLDHESTIHKPGEPKSWEALPPETATFTPDITPLTLAAHRDNYEIIKILLDRGATLPDPHHVRCGCNECVTSRLEDSLRHSRSRINAYRALASPSLISLSSKDPILTAFELSWELRRLSSLEHEFKNEYQELRQQCQDFATALLDHTRSSSELEVLLNHDPTGPAFEHGERMHLNRLKQAIKLRQKKFVAHPNVQQLLASIWYEGLPGFRRKNMFLQGLEVFRIGILFPIFSLMYIFFPRSEMGQTMRKPFIKFICHSASYFTFLFLLILASQRIESVLGDLLGFSILGFGNSRFGNSSFDNSSFDNSSFDNSSFYNSSFYNSSVSNSTDSKVHDVTTKRGATPTFVEWLILCWVAGLIWSEVKQLWDVGLREYVRDMWNVIDFITMALYVATTALRIVAYFRVQKEIVLSSQLNTTYTDLQREEWDTWDPMLIAEGLFSAANIFSSLKLVYIFSVNPYLGPLQVSLSRMVLDIMKFFFLYVLVLFSFSCGLNQLLWYYADMEKKKCIIIDFDSSSNTSRLLPSADRTACLVWRRFSNLFETTQTLFWAVFGLVDLDSFELEGIKTFTRFWGMLMFGTYSVINIVVLLNLLIAMMNHSYQLISERADTEWKFARSKLWISYFEEGGTVPPPFNIIPTPKSVKYFMQWLYKKLCGHSRAAKKEHMRTIRTIMRNLVRRYVTVDQRRVESQGVTEDDVNEIKQDISAFRCELIEILKNSGMNTSTATGTGTGSGGKKNRQKERRLMKGFNIASAPAGPPPLSPVVEFITHPEIHRETNQPDELFDSNVSGETSGPHTLPRKSNLLRRTGPRTTGPLPHSLSTRMDQPPQSYKSLLNVGSKLNSSKRNPNGKRRWGTLIEAAKSGKVRKLTSRCRSEDSVCKFNKYPTTKGMLNADNATESPSDSIRSLTENFGIGLSSLSNLGFGQFGPLAKFRRKKKSLKRPKVTADDEDDDTSMGLTTISRGYPLVGTQGLRRSSSVPMRNPEPRGVRFSHTPLEEGAAYEGEGSATGMVPSPSSPHPRASPRPSTSASREARSTLINIPGVQPVSGHMSQDWL